MKSNTFSKISLALAAATLLTVVVFVQLAFPEVSSDEETHVAGALAAMWIFRVAAILGLTFGAIGLLFATAALIRKERLAMVVFALSANLPIPVLSLMILVRNLK